MIFEQPKIGNVIPKDVSIFYEDGVPFIKYRGTTYVDGRKVEVSIPKMDLYLREINTLADVKYESRTGECVVPVRYRQDVYTIKDSFFTMRLINED